MTKTNGSNNLSCQKSPIKFAFYVATTGAKEEEGFFLFWHLKRLLRRRAKQTPGLDDHKVSSEFPDGLEPSPALIQKLELKSQILTAGNPIAQNFRLKFKFIIQVEIYEYLSP